MGIFDKLKSTAQQAVNSAAQSAGNRRETFTFSALPESLAEMQALPEAGLDSPFKTAALTVLALCAYAAAARKEENGRLYFDGLTLLWQKRRDNIAIEEWRRI